MTIEQPFTERIRELRAELDAFIDKLADEEAPRCPGVPRGVLRNLITKGSGCQCSVVLRLEEKKRD